MRRLLVGPRFLVGQFAMTTARPRRQDLQRQEDDDARKRREEGRSRWALRISAGAFLLAALAFFVPMVEGWVAQANRTSASIEGVGGNFADVASEKTKVTGQSQSIVVNVHKGRSDGSFWVIVHPDNPRKVKNYYPFALPALDRAVCVKDGKSQTSASDRCGDITLGLQVDHGVFDVSVYAATPQESNRVTAEAAALRAPGAVGGGWVSLPTGLHLLQQYVRLRHD